MRDHFANKRHKPYRGTLNLPVTAALEAETVSTDFLHGNYQSARGKPFTGDEFFRDREALADAGKLSLYPLQVGNAERLAHTLMKVENAARILRKLLEHGLSDPQAFAEIGNIFTSAGQTVGKNYVGVAASQHRDEERWELSESARTERVLIDVPGMYAWGTAPPVKCAIGDAVGGTLSKHIAADLVSKRRKTVADRQFELATVGADVT